MRLVLPDNEQILPRPLRIFLEQEEATPLLGFPVMQSVGLRALQPALEVFFQAEAKFQITVLRGAQADRRFTEEAWEGYRGILEEVTENAVRSSFGRRLASVFWLYHSTAIARLLKELPRSLLRQDLQVARAHGDAIKYRIFNRYLDRVLALTFDVVHRIAEEAEEDEKDLFPTLLTRMRDNVLILTENHISADLAELDSYFRGYLRIDGKDFRERLERLEAWSAERLTTDAVLRSTATTLARWRRGDPPRQLFKQPGWVQLLSQSPSYDTRELFDAEQVKVWENLLLKLKEFEILAGFRRLVTPVSEEDGRMVCQAPQLRGGGRIARTLVLSSSTRPIDFNTTWVIDPLVRRFGLIYDITDFSAIVSVLGRAGTQDQDSSYRSIFRFQRRVNQMARAHRLQLEKYLGDGALYSGRHTYLLLSMAVQLQRYYRRALEESFPFDRGMRIALNYGEYRLLPIEEGEAGSSRRYEFFGHGIVELSRLATGKSSREVEDVKNLLVGLGYSGPEVDRFFAPLEHQNVDLIDRREEDRQFFCYIDRSGALINEGIAATERFMKEVDRSGVARTLYAAREGARRYLAFSLPSGAESIWIGVRKLGLASLKGLDRAPVYEVIDGSIWGQDELTEIVPGGLMYNLDGLAGPETTQ
jgi:hypothetical protein